MTTDVKRIHMAYSAHRPIAMNTVHGLLTRVLTCFRFIRYVLNKDTLHS